MPEQVLNAWGEPIDPEDPADAEAGHWVPEDERKDDDFDDNANALTEETGDDITGVEVEGRPDIPEPTDDEKKAIFAEAVDAPEYAEPPE